MTDRGDHPWQLSDPKAWRRIAHDVRSPLGLISGSLEELEHDLEARPTARSARLLSLADRGVAHLIRIAALLTASAEAEQGELSPERSRRELGPVLEAALSNIARMDPRADLSVSTSIPSGLEVDIDVEQTLLALGEVLLSARRAAETRMQVTARAEGSAVHVTVEDDRDPELSASRLDAGDTYGVAIATMLLARNGAEVQAASEPGGVLRLVFKRD